MAPPAGTLRVWRYFLALFLLLALLYSIVAFGSRHSPKLGLDLVGGAQVTFTAKTPNGSTPPADSMQEAKQIIENRVNGSGVSGADVVTQGTDQIVVSVPGGTKADIAKLGAAAVLNFRAMVAPAVQQACTTAKQAGKSGTSGAGASSSPTASTSSAPSTGASASASAHPSATIVRPSKAPQSGAAAAVRPLGKAPAKSSPAAAKPSRTGSRSGAASSPAHASGKARSSAATSASPTSAPASSAAAPSAAPSTQTAPACSLHSVQQAAKQDGLTVPLTEDAYQKLSSTQQGQLTQALQGFDCSQASEEKDVATSYFVACDSSGLVHLLGPVIVAGKQINTASAIAPNTQQPIWSVQLVLKGSGQSAWANWTSAHNIGSTTTTGADYTACGSTGTPCADFVCFTLDGAAISCPVTEEAINGQATQISGNFTQNSATQLADELKYGALPLSFRADQAQSVSATLGTAQLRAGLLAGGIGLLLVVVYSLLYYRALGLVTIASLAVSGVLTYGSLVLLGTQIGFTLSLAGIAGFIVAVGITADSFVVFFERLKDEVHEGRSIRVAVPRAWVRARRTILSADTVSFLAAAILYYFAAGDVRGFAFTLGLSTILDLIVVFLFTHPMVSLLSRSRAFGSAKFTGLNALRGIPVADEPLTRTPRTPRGDRRVDVGEPAAAVDGGATAVAVLDREEDASAPEPAEPEQAARRTTAPAGGTAAERAAARRARLREQQQGRPSGPQGTRQRPDDEENR